MEVSFRFRQALRKKTVKEHYQHNKNSRSQTRDPIEIATPSPTRKPAGSATVIARWLQSPSAARGVL
jgi:hypothetical protein